MKRLVIEEIERLPSYTPGKPIEEVQREYGIKNVVKLASNENPIGPSPKAIGAITSALSQLNRYPDSEGFYLKEKIASKLKVKKNNIILGNGSDEVLQMIVRTFLFHGGEVIMGDPTFAFYRIIVGAARGKAVLVPLKNFVYDLEQMREKVNTITKIIILTNPNNPTGTIIRKKDFNWFLKSIPEDVIVAVDEAYGEYVQSRDFPDVLEYLNSGKKVMVLRTFSKIYGLAGLRIGYGIGDSQLISYLEKIREPFNTNSLAQIGALAALDDEEHVEKSRRNNQEGLRYLSTELNRLGVDCLPTEANFFLLNVKMDAQAVYQSLLKDGIIVRPMDSYGLKKYIRVTVGLPEENERFVQSLGKVLKKIEK